MALVEEVGPVVTEAERRVEKVWMEERQVERARREE